MNAERVQRIIAKILAVVGVVAALSISVIALYPAPPNHFSPALIAGSTLVLALTVLLFGVWPKEGEEHMLASLGCIAAVVIGMVEAVTEPTSHPRFITHQLCIIAGALMGVSILVLRQSPPAPKTAS